MGHDNHNGDEKFDARAFAQEHAVAPSMSAGMAASGDRGLVPAEQYQVVVPQTKFAQWKESRSQALDYLVSNGDSALTLDFLTANDLPVYVRNNTGNSSTLLWNMVDNSGRRVGVELKAAPIPYDMTKRFGADVLAQSPEFLDLLFKKLLVLVRPDVAEKELQNPIVQAFINKSTSKVANVNPNVAPRSVDPTAGANSGSVTERMRSIVFEVQKGTLESMNAVLAVFGSINLFNGADFNYFYGQLADPKFKAIVDQVREEAIRRGIHA